MIYTHKNVISVFMCINSVA